MLLRHPVGKFGHCEYDGPFLSKCTLNPTLTHIPLAWCHFVFTGSKHCQKDRCLQERRRGQEEAPRVNNMGPHLNSVTDRLEQRNIFIFELWWEKAEVLQTCIRV